MNKIRILIACLALAIFTVLTGTACSTANIAQKSETTLYATNGTPLEHRLVESNTRARGDAKQLIERLKASNTKATLSLGAEGAETTVTSSNFWRAAEGMAESAAKIAASLSAPGAGAITPLMKNPAPLIGNPAIPK